MLQRGSLCGARQKPWPLGDHTLWKGSPFLGGRDFIASFLPGKNNPAGEGTVEIRRPLADDDRFRLLAVLPEAGLVW